MKLRKTITIGVTATVLALASACGGSGGDSDSSSIELVFAGYQPENGSAQADTVKYWMEEVTERTGGQVTFRESWGGALLPAGEIYAAVGDGRVDIGWESTVYYSTFPLSAIVNIPFVTADQRAVAETFAELYDSYDPLREEWHANGIEMLAMFPSDANTTAASEPITTLADYEGKSIRAVGETPTALQAIGANPVSINVTELYESLERGLVDGYMNIPLSPGVSLSYYEVAPHITHDGVGIYGSAQLAISKDRFDSLPASVQEVMLEVAAELPEADAQHVVTRDEAACDTWLENGGSVHELSDDDIQRWRDLNQDAPTESWRSTAEDSGSPADEFYDLYHSVLDPKLDGAEETLSGVQRCARR